MDKKTGNIFYASYQSHQIRVLTPPPNFTVAVTAPVCDSRWHHVAVTYDGAKTLALYVDGLLTTNVTTKWSVFTALNASAALNIGGVPGYAAEGFSGSISDVRVWSSALTAAQIAALSQPPSLPSFTNVTMTPATPTPGTTTYTWACSSGFIATTPITQRTMTLNTATNTWGAMTAGPLTCTQAIYCAAGQYATSPTTCGACAAGSISTGGASACTPCDAGQYSTAGNTVCTPCAAGTAAAIASNSCAACAPGAVSTSTGNAYCTVCAAGSYAPSATQACQLCNPGTFASSISATSCAACAAGYIAPNAGTASCTLCPGGTTALNTTFCTPCSPGTAAGAGASGATCPACGAGNIAPNAGASFCLPCSAGSYAISALACAQCGAGTFAPIPTGAGATTCTACPPGSSAQAGAAACIPCAPGTYFTGGACVACSGSTYSFGGAATACSACAPGYTFVSASAGCALAAVSAAGPVDTVLAFSGTQAEGTAAFSAANPSGLTYGASPFGAPNGALRVAQGSFLQSGAQLPQLPTATAARSFSAWVKCPAPSLTSAAVLDFGDGSTNAWSEHMQLAALSPSGTAKINVPAYTSSILAGSATCSSGFADGTGTSVLFAQTNGICFAGTSGPYAGKMIVTDRTNYRVRVASLSGVVQTLAGTGTSATRDGVGTNAQFALPITCIVDAAGQNVYIGAGNDHSIRQLNLATLAVVTFAGQQPPVAPALGATMTGAYVDGTGTSARFNYPVGLTFDQFANVSISHRATEGPTAHSKTHPSNRVYVSGVESLRPLTHSFTHSSMSATLRTARSARSPRALSSPPSPAARARLRARRTSTPSARPRSSTARAASCSTRSSRTSMWPTMAPTSFAASPCPRCR